MNFFIIYNIKSGLLIFNTKELDEYFIHYKYYKEHATDGELICQKLAGDWLCTIRADTPLEAALKFNDLMSNPNNLIRAKEYFGCGKRSKKHGNE